AGPTSQINQQFGIGETTLCPLIASGRLTRAYIGVDRVTQVRSRPVIDRAELVQRCFNVIHSRHAETRVPRPTDPPDAQPLPIAYGGSDDPTCCGGRARAVAVGAAAAARPFRCT